MEIKGGAELTDDFDNTKSQLPTENGDLSGP